MENKVYIIFENDLKEGRKNVYGVYANKEKAKRKVDQLTSVNIENDDIDYVIESYEVNG